MPLLNVSECHSYTLRASCGCHLVFFRQPYIFLCCIFFLTWSYAFCYSVPVIIFTEHCFFVFFPACVCIVDFVAGNPISSCHCHWVSLFYCAHSAASSVAREVSWHPCSLLSLAVCFFGMSVGSPLLLQDEVSTCFLLSCGYDWADHSWCGCLAWFVGVLLCSFFGRLSLHVSV